MGKGEYQCFNCGTRPAWADDLCWTCWRAFPGLRPKDYSEFEEAGIRLTLEEIRNLDEV